ncbi:Major facilitator superfamily [Trypanosoma melophagium]|uniref:Major facilitator superfamily n=1 Tax=Trypanosoma melophagium TaxID=715481 RepID=UPI00351AA5AA|nr:Major facilitator superfamily [Trypanosoma melophagium]
MGYILEGLREMASYHFFNIQLSNALMGMGAGLEVPLITLMGRQLLYSQDVIANYVTLAAVFRVMADIPSGILAEYADIRRLMPCSVLVYAAACAIAFFVESGSISLSIFSIFGGFSIGVFFLTRHIYVSRTSKKEHRGMVLSFLSGMLRWAHVVGPILLGVVASKWNDERYYFIVPLVSSLAAWLCIEIDCLSWCSLKEEVREARSEWETKQLLPRSQPHYLSIPSSAIPNDAAVAVDYSNGGNNNSKMADAVKERVAVQPSYDSTAEIYRSDVCSETHTTSAEMLKLKEDNTNYGCISYEENKKFRLIDLWYLIVGQWTTIWCLGFYIILYVSLRANRKLLLTFAAMRVGFTNSQIAFLLSLSFTFDACLFPVGGIIMDLFGRRFAMLPPVLGLSLAFVLLPISHSFEWLHVMAAIFGTVDALGCGLVMTLIADHAPGKFGGLFFGVMRTVQDLGHIVAALVVSVLLRHVDFVICCYIWGVVGVVAALWARFVVPHYQ